jgi:hypothetical protein
MKKYTSISIFIFMITITLSCFCMEPVLYEAPKETIEFRGRDTYTSQSINHLSNHHHTLEPQEIAAIEQAMQKKLEQQKINTTVPIELRSEPTAQNMYVMQSTIKPENFIDKNNTIIDTKQDLFTPENKSLDLTPKENQNLLLPIDKKFTPTENNTNFMQKPSGNFNQTFIDNNPNKTTGIIHQEENQTSKFLTRLLRGFINKSLFAFFNQQLLLSASTDFSELSFGEALIEGIIEIIITMQTELQTIENHDFDNFKMQIQYLAEQIKKYNSTSVYHNVDQMLLFIKYMNQFLKENNVIYFSQAMAFKLDDVLTTSSTCCDIIRNQNIILSKKSTPDKVISFFQPTIDTTNQLSDFSDYYKTMHDIYDANGNIDHIIQGWKKFQSSRLYKTPLNRQYGAFITFLLLFENSIIATAIILNKTSSLYKVTNPVSVTINIA